MKCIGAAIPALLIWVACSQLVSAAPPAFEVATVRASGPKSRMVGVLTYPGGRILAQNRTLVQLTEEAFNLQAFQISGGPGWAREIRYDVEAKPPADSKAGKSKPSNFKLPMNDEQREMLQTLLADRFQLKFHRETRQAPVYRLSQSGKKLMLEPAKDREAFPWIGGMVDGQRAGMITGTGVAGINASMELLAVRLSRYLERPVLDQTGLAGSFDFGYAYVADDPHPDVLSSILVSVQGLGLKLESAKGPVQMVVIDGAEKASEN
jgi:uncharacterized protein (TIGR03435 family)